MRQTDHHSTPPSARPPEVRVSASHTDAAAPMSIGRPGPPWLLIGIVAAAVLLIGALFAFQVVHAGRVYPGVVALGVDLSGLDRAEAVAALAPRIQLLTDRPITLRGVDREWRSSAGDLGLRLDAEALAERAVMFGREGSLPARLVSQVRGVAGATTELSLDVAHDTSVLNVQLARLAAQIDQPAVDATIELQSDLTIAIAPSQVGRRVDRDESSERVRAAVLNDRETSVELAIVETPPQLTESDLQDARLTAERMLAGPFILRWRDRSWELQPTEIAKTITFQPDAGQSMLRI